MALDASSSAPWYRYVLSPSGSRVLPGRVVAGVPVQEIKVVPVPLTLPCGMMAARHVQPSPRARSACLRV